MSTHALESGLRPTGSHRSTLGSLMLALPALIALASCDSQGSSNSGSRNGGATGSGGSAGLFGSQGGAGGQGSGSGGSPGVQIMESGMAVAKFCNPIFGGPNREDLELTLEVGTSAVKFTAGSIKCAPAVGQGCMAIPAGIVPFVLKLRGVVQYQFIAEVPAGGKVILISTLDDTRTKLMIEGGTLDPNESCEEFDPFTPPPDAGVPDGGAGGAGGAGAAPGDAGAKADTAPPKADTAPPKL